MKQKSLHKTQFIRIPILHHLYNFFDMDQGFTNRMPKKALYDKGMTIYKRVYASFSVLTRTRTTGNIQDQIKG